MIKDITEEPIMEETIIETKRLQKKLYMYEILEKFETERQDIFNSLIQELQTKINFVEQIKFKNEEIDILLKEIEFYDKMILKLKNI